MRDGGETGRMPETSSSDQTRSVTLAKVGEGRYVARNARGGSVVVGSGADPDLTPVELLLAAVAGCSAIDVDLITGKRAAATTLEVVSEGAKVRDDDGNHLTDVALTFTVRFPEGADGDAARAVLARSVAQSRDRLCTVGRTVQVATPVDYRVEAEDGSLSRP